MSSLLKWIAVAGCLLWAGASVGQSISSPGGSTSPGGSNGQLQYNNAGAFGGFTLGGDCTLAQPNITCTKSNGSTFGSNAFTSTAYAPLASPTFTGTVTGPDSGTWGSGGFGSIAALGINQTVPSTYLFGVTGTAQTGSGANGIAQFAQTWNTTGKVTGFLQNITNTASAANSLLYDFQVGGVSKGALDVNGALYVGANPNSTNAQFWQISGATLALTRSGSGSYQDMIFAVGGNNSFGIVNSSPRRAEIVNGGAFAWSVDGTPNSSAQAQLTSPGTGSVQLGAADAASPVGQALSAQSVSTGTSNTNGVNWTLKGSTSTGSGTAGDIIFQTGGTGAGATSQNAQVTALTLKGATQEAIFNAPVRWKGYTVSTLPAGNTGDNAYVTDAVACTFLATLTGGGSTVCPVFYNGTAWVGA
jgi:hypothetical protein